MQPMSGADCLHGNQVEETRFDRFLCFDVIVLLVVVTWSWLDRNCVEPGLVLMVLLNTYQLPYLHDAVSQLWLHYYTAAQCIVIGPVCLLVAGWVCVFVCVWVIHPSTHTQYHDNSKLKCIDPHQTGFVDKGSDRL